jgi:organic hydroperoxide reductase OsmC/OhrA
MQQLPHRYAVQARGPVTGELQVDSSGLPELRAAAPAEFDGPGDRWSPETLVVAAVASCLILTFRSVATASRFEWISLDCSVVGTLDKADDGRRFTLFEIRAEIGLADPSTEERARRLLEKAEDLCLVSNSLKAERRLEVVVKS